MIFKTMVRKEKEQKSSYVEKDSAIVDGIDISGHWNKMYQPREIMNYDVTPLEDLRALPGAESIGNCYQCAQCIGVCPIDNVGDYGPRKIYRKLQMGMNLLESVDLWQCTTCMNCLRVCPKEVNMIDIMPAAREKAILDGKEVPAELQEMFQNCAEYGNPMGESPRKRARWAKKADVEVKDLSKNPEPVDVLWFVGDYYAYHGRGNDAAQAMARVLTKLGVNFGTLGAEERCDGDSQRLAGEKGLYEMLAEHNIEKFNSLDFKKMVVSGPHAYNAIKNEYPKMGGTYDVDHYTQFLSAMMDKLKPLMTKEFGKKVTFHDPCYLGRHNGEYEAPRTLLNAIPGIQFSEMFRNKEQGYCCGGGGGGMWLDGFMADNINERLSENRVKEAIAVGAEVLAVCCPYEVSRFEDAVKSTGNEGKLEVLDIIEIIDRCIEE